MNEVGLRHLNRVLRSVACAPAWMRWSGRARLVSCVCEADQLRMPPGWRWGPISRAQRPCGAGEGTHLESRTWRTWILILELRLGLWKEHMVAEVIL